MLIWSGGSDAASVTVMIGLSSIPIRRWVESPRRLATTPSHDLTRLQLEFGTDLAGQTSIANSIRATGEASA